jgi:hypothetical protein
MSLFDWLKPAPSLDAQTRHWIAHTVEMSEPTLKQLANHERLLAPAVRYAQDYCDSMAQQIPGPIEISRAAFAADPLVHAIFGSADDIPAMLAKSQCVREHLDEMTLADGQCCAVLGMRHREKSGFGVGLSGNIVRTDVPQRTLYFTDHTLAEPSPDLAAARQRLRAALFDGLLKSFAAHVADARTERDGLSREHAIIHAQLRAQHAPDHSRRLEALSERLGASREALQPQRLLDTLIDTLNHPEPHLNLSSVNVKVDRSGILVGPDNPDGDTLRFTELTVRDKRRWVVILALINRDDVRAALERLETSRRYIVI